MFLLYADAIRSRYLSQLAQSEAMRSIVDGGRLGVAATSNASSSGPLEGRPWGYMFWQLNDVPAPANISSVKTTETSAIRVS
eukprot:COSAG06_NODE_3084_length_5880_cov_3.762325_2_plen_82_part_00